MTPQRIGFFTRMLEQAGASHVYRNALEQVRRAEEVGFDTAWVSQHHFSNRDGGLPSPLVFLASAAAVTTRIRLGTAVITLPFENPVRVAEDASVVDAISEGRLELGMGSGGARHPGAAPTDDSTKRALILRKNIEFLKDCLRGDDLGGDGTHIYPPADGLDRRLWQATSSIEGAVAAGRVGDGLMLGRTHIRPADDPRASLTSLQLPMLEAYLDALPDGVEPRVLATRTIFVADDRAEALRFAGTGLARAEEHFERSGVHLRGTTLEERIRTYDVHLGTVEDVTESLAQDAILGHATEVAIQVHSVDPPHPFVLRSLELFADGVAPALGWKSSLQRV